MFRPSLPRVLPAVADDFLTPSCAGLQAAVSLATQGQAGGGVVEDDVLALARRGVGRGSAVLIALKHRIDPCHVRPQLLRHRAFPPPAPLAQREGETAAAWSAALAGAGEGAGTQEAIPDSLREALGDVFAGFEAQRQALLEGDAEHVHAATERLEARVARLRQALPDYLIFTQVQLSRMLDVDVEVDYHGWINRINRMSVDFVVCAPDGATILAAIEHMLQPGSGAPRTPDLGGTGSTSDVGKAIAALI